MAGSFSASVSDWVAKTEKRTEAVYKASVQRVIEAAQVPVAAGGNMPVDTGFLRASLVVSLGMDVPAGREKPEAIAAFNYTAMQVDLVINGATINTPITAAWTANYARHVEYGARGRPGRKFRDLAAQRWPSIVAEVSREAQTRAGG